MIHYLDMRQTDKSPTILGARVTRGYTGAKEIK